MTLRVVPVGVRAARRIVEAMHAHHHAPPGALFCVGVADNDRLACVAIVSRPVARMLDASPVVAEVTRCASDRTPHAARRVHGDRGGDPRGCRARLSRLNPGLAPVNEVM